MEKYTFCTRPQPVLRTETHTRTHLYMYTYRYRCICLSHAVKSYSEVRPRSIAYCALRPAAVSVCAVKEPCLTAVKTTSLLCTDINFLIPFAGLQQIAQQQDAQVWDLLKNNLLFSSSTTQNNTYRSSHTWRFCSLI